MAASITTAATTLEGQIFETVCAAQALEYAIPEASRPNQVTIALDTEARTITLSATFEATVVNTGSDLKFTPVAYLP